MATTKMRACLYCFEAGIIGRDMIEYKTGSRSHDGEFSGRGSRHAVVRALHNACYDKYQMYRGGRNPTIAVF